ncbi:hypothetical protein BDR06DRAFT_1014911 [Suillus hirtellus]|nr:hypothetical protein BDR06DRAFT_1014911 [Suillus hirtellus]
MPPHSQATSSPKRVKAKRKVVESDITAVTVQGKKARAADKAGLVSLQLTSDINAPIRRSGHPGAGTGGRNAQLEKVAAVLEAPARTNLPKGSTTLTPNISANPLAPEPCRKGRGCPPKPPPPYSITDSTGSAVVSSRWKGKKAKRCAKPYWRPSVFFQWAVQWGSSAISVSFTSSYLRLTFTSSVHYERRANISLQHPDSEDSDTSSSDESSGEDSDDPADIDNAGEREFGWAEVGGHHSAHPGFSREPEPSPVHATSILAPDLEFQYSHDDDDMNAKQALAFNNPSSHESAPEGAQRVPEVSELGSQVQHQSVDISQGIQESDGSQPEDVADDVLGQHHKTNGRPHLPNPASLELLHHVARKKDPTNDEDPDDKQQPAKGRHGPKPTQLSFYPAHWKNFLKDAKGACRAQHALENPFPALVKDSPGSIAEALLAVLVQWDEAGKQFEPGYWPGHKPNMVKLLYEDLSTWRSELKKNVVVIASMIPGLVPLSNIPPQECASWVEGAAAGLKAGLKFLCDGVDEQGKTRNFANPALCDAIIMFMYTGPYRIVRRHPDIFSKQLPLSCLALVCAVFVCVLNGLIKNGSRQSFPKFTAKEYGPTYKSALKSLQDIMKDPYHGPKLVEQLQSAACCKVDGNEVPHNVDIEIMLD